MKTKRFPSVGLVCLGILMFTALGWAKTYHFASTKVDPSAMGDVDVSKDKNGNEVVISPGGAPGEADHAYSPIHHVCRVVSAAGIRSRKRRPNEGWGRSPRAIQGHDTFA